MNSFTLRNWEDRYQLFSPSRDPNGRRIFSEIETVRAICAAQLVEKDFKIGKIAPRLIQEKDPTLILNEYIEGEHFVRLRADALDHLLSFSAVSFRMTFDLLVANYSLEFLVDHFFYPIFRKLEELSLKKEITLFQEKFTNHHLRSRMHRLIGIAQLNHGAPYGNKKVLITGLPTNQYEDSVLLLNLMLERYGWQVFYGGSQMPIEELDQAVKATGSDVVILVGNAISIQDYGTFAPELEKISAPVVLGGKLALRLRDENYPDTQNVELSQLRPGPLAKLMNYKITKSL